MPKVQATEGKISRFHQNVELLCFKEYYQESEKTTEWVTFVTFANHVPPKVLG